MNPFRWINLSRFQPVQQIFGRKIDRHDLVCLRDNFIGHALFHAHPSRLLDDIVERFEMLNVDCADDVDTGSEQILNVLVAFPVSASRRVGVCQLIHQRDHGFAREKRVEVHFPESDVVIFRDPRRHDLQVADLGGRVRTIMRLDVSDDNIDPAFFEAVAFN